MSCCSVVGEEHLIIIITIFNRYCNINIVLRDDKIIAKAGKCCLAVWNGKI